MKPTYVKGDLFETKETLIAHGCNAQGVMGAGVARIVREKYPSAYETYVLRKKKFGLKMGQVIFAKSGDRLIANCITQNKFGSDGKRYVDYEAIRESMIQINAYCRVKKLKSFGMPKIGAGLGGGDWNTIEKIIEETCVDTQAIVYEL